MPAEYSRNPKNISRDKWEKEMSMKEIILRDAKMCAYAAGNVEHLKHEMERGCKETGVPIIRIHDLRHSHVSLLIHMGFTALAIGNRVGHEAEKITYRYAHLFPTVQTEMANKLDMERMEKEDEI